jgi:hypothetical protein
MSFKLKKEICIQCSLSTREILGVNTGVLRCSECQCIITIKEKLKMNCPKFDSVEEMLVYKKAIDNSNKG